MGRGGGGGETGDCPSQLSVFPLQSLGTGSGVCVPQASALPLSCIASLASLLSIPSVTFSARQEEALPCGIAQ